MWPLAAHARRFKDRLDFLAHPARVPVLGRVRLLLFQHISGAAVDDLKQLFRYVLGDGNVERLPGLVRLRMMR